MKVAITGAAGFLGQRLVPKLAALHQVFPSDLREEGGEPAVLRADVLEHKDMKQLCAGMDAVIHLACASWQEGLSEAANEARILDTRLKGTCNVMAAAVEQGVGRVIQISDLGIFSGYDEGLRRANSRPIHSLR